MTKEELETRIKLISDKIVQYQAEYNALIGAKIECEYWLAEAIKKESVILEN